MVCHGVLERLHPTRASVGRVSVVALLAANLFAHMLGHATPAPAADVQAPPREMAPAAPLGQVWIGAHRSIQTLAAVDDATTNAFFAGPTSYGLGGWGGSSVGAEAWASEAKFASDLAAGRVPADVHVVMYDPENWSATPAGEQADPVTAMRTFAMLARRYGYTVMITPHPSLVDAVGAVCGAGESESERHAYLRCGIQADAARYADVVEVQAQSMEANPAAYRDFVRRATAQARRANPGVLVLSGLSTNFAHDPTVLFRAWQSVSDVVDGHYLNVPHGRRPGVAVAFLKMVIGSTTGTPTI